MVYFNEPLPQKILDSVPPHDHINPWWTYEIHNPPICKCDGPDPSSESFGRTRDWGLFEYLNTVDKYVPFVAHYGFNIECYTQTIGNGPIIKIIPDLEFINLAIGLKWDLLSNGQPASLCLNEYKKWEDSLASYSADLVIDQFNPLSDSFFTHLAQVTDLLNISINNDITKLYIEKYRNYHLV